MIQRSTLDRLTVMGTFYSSRRVALSIDLAINLSIEPWVSDLLHPPLFFVSHGQEVIYAAKSLEKVSSHVKELVGFDDSGNPQTSAVFKPLGQVCLHTFQNSWALIIPATANDYSG